MVKLLGKSDSFAIFLNVFSHDRRLPYIHSFLTGSLNANSGFDPSFFSDLFSISGFIYQFFKDLDYYKKIGRDGFSGFVEENSTSIDEVTKHGDTVLKMIRNNLRRMPNGHINMSSFNRVFTYLMVLKEFKQSLGVS